MSQTLHTFILASNWSPAPVQFYVLEAALESYARDLLFLLLLTEPLAQVGLQGGWVVMDGLCFVCVHLCMWVWV